MKFGVEHEKSRLGRADPSAIADGQRYPTLIS